MTKDKRLMYLNINCDRSQSQSVVKSPLSILPHRQEERESIRKQTIYKANESMINAKLTSIFKDIQMSIEDGREVEIKGIGLKETPYNKLLLGISRAVFILFMFVTNVKASHNLRPDIEAEKMNKVVKRRDFIENLEIEKRLTARLRNTTEARVYQQLEKQLVNPNSDIDASDTDLFINTRAVTIESDPLKDPQDKKINKLFSSLVKLTNKGIQSHLRKLDFDNGVFKLKPCDSNK